MASHNFYNAKGLVREDLAKCFGKLIEKCRKENTHGGN